jgi:transposase InsO family protein
VRWRASLLSTAWWISPGFGRSCSTATSYLALLKKYGMPRSMSGKGNCYDNAVAESFFGSLKNEIVHHRNYQTRDEARTEVFDYVELFYNRKRLHQSLNYQTPMKYKSDKVSSK